MNTENLIFLIITMTTVVVAVLSSLTYILSKRMRKVFYDFDKKSAELEEVRSSFEKRINELTNRLLSTELRWRDAYHLILSSQKATSKEMKTHEVVLSDFIKNVGISGEDVEIDKKLIFVLTPFHKNHEKTFYVIRDACLAVGLNCLRGDEQYIEGEIFPHILRHIIKARIIIANIDGRNPNVFYELGIAHAIGKPTILIGKAIPKAPFDVSAKKILLYKDYEYLYMTIKDELTRILIGF